MLIEMAKLCEHRIQAFSQNDMSQKNESDSACEATRTRIIRLATQVFAQKGFSAGSVREIANLARVNEVTVFRYFPRKQDLSVAVIESVAELMRPPQELIESLSNGGSPAKVVTEMYGFLRQRMSAQIGIGRLICFAALESESSAQAYMRLLGPLLEVLKRYFDVWHERGMMAGVDSYTAAVVLASSMLSHCRWELLDATEPPSDHAPIGEDCCNLWAHWLTAQNIEKV